MKLSELEKLLRENSCKLDHHGTRHDIWHSEKTGEYFPVPRHAKEIPNGTLSNILKSAGVK